MHRLLLLAALLVTATACAAQGGLGGAPGEDEPKEWLTVERGGAAMSEEEEAARLAAIADSVRRSPQDEVGRLEQEALRQAVADDPVATDDGALVPGDGSLPADVGSLLVRTDPGHQDQWVALVASLDEPDADGFQPFLVPVDHERWAGASVADLAAAAPSYVLLVVADEAAVTSPDAPLVVVQVADGEVRQLRVARTALASVENNLSLANMDWEDFSGSVDADGVFRGFE